MDTSFSCKKPEADGEINPAPCLVIMLDRKYFITNLTMEVLGCIAVMVESLT